LMADNPLNRFKRSMEINYEKWHDGVGYDIEALRQASAPEREAIEKMLLSRNPLDWRDVEALSILHTKSADEALRRAARDPNPEVRMAVARYSPENITNSEHLTSTLQALQTATFYRGLTQTLDQVEVFHPPEVIAELLHGALMREGQVAVHFAAMLFYLHGKGNSAFDMRHRPFFLRFNTEDRSERERVFRELCQVIGVSPEKYV
jgi:hypothetical protein